MAQVAALGYCSPTNGNEAPDKIAEIHLVPNEKEIIAYFWGKNLSPNEWKMRPKVLVNFDFSSLFNRPPDNTLVDKIWNMDVQVMLPQLYRKIQNYENYEKLIFTGHGVGGAYALLAGLYFEIEKSKGNGKFKDLQTAIVTFGQPRIGTAKFARAVNELGILIARVTNANDYVPRKQLPPRNDFFYMHHGLEFWIDVRDCNCAGQANVQGSEEEIGMENFKLYTCPSSEEHPLCNVGQKGEDKTAYKAHKGPYFGVVMGLCDTRNLIGE
ncbi:hypothetical protein G9A89_003826 [Geosiphon pyriformis]|nr:hypothetical protein G9A89_003826 [Geosiphon pyriformis]